MKPTWESEEICKLRIEASGELVGKANGARCHWRGKCLQMGTLREDNRAGLSGSSLQNLIVDQMHFLQRKKEKNSRSEKYICVRCVKTIV